MPGGIVDAGGETAILLSRQVGDSCELRGKTAASSFVSRVIDDHDGNVRFVRGERRQALLEFRVGAIADDDDGRGHAGSRDR